MDSTAVIETPPSSLSISLSALTFLDSQLNSIGDLLRTSSLASELRNQCHGLDQCLSDLKHSFEATLLAYASYSDRIGDVNSKLTDLRSSTYASTSQADGGEVLLAELPTLAKEVARVEAVRTDCTEAQYYGW